MIESDANAIIGIFIVRPTKSKESNRLFILKESLLKLILQFVSKQLNFLGSQRCLIATALTWPDFLPTRDACLGVALRPAPNGSVRLAAHVADRHRAETRAVARTISARQTTFDGVLRFATRRSSVRRFGLSRAIVMLPSVMADTLPDLPSDQGQVR